MPCKPFSNCFEFIEGKRAVVICVDKRSVIKYTCQNNCLIILSQYKIDNCLVKSGKRCDFLVVNCDKKKSLFIELNGSDLIAAVEQIDATINSLKDALTGFSFHARIVLTRVNTVDLKNTKYLKLEKKLQRLRGDIIKQSQQLTESD